MADTGNVNVDTLEAKVREALVHINGRTNFWHDAISALSDLAARAREAEAEAEKSKDELENYAQQVAADHYFARAEVAEADRDRLARRVAELERTLEVESGWTANDLARERTLKRRVAELEAERDGLKRIALAAEASAANHRAIANHWRDEAVRQESRARALAGDGGGAHDDLPGGRFE